MFSANLSQQELQRRDLEERVNKPTNAPPLYSESLAQLQVRHLYRYRILFPRQINGALAVLQVKDIYCSQFLSIVKS